MSNLEREKIFVTWVHDQPGVLTRVASAFFRRGINIINLTVGATHIDGVSKMVIRTRGSDRELEQLSRYIRREVNVLEVELHDPEVDAITELCSVRVLADTEEERGEILDAVHVYRPELARMEHDSIVLNLSSTPSTIDHFVDALKSFRLCDVSRTGVTTLPGRSNPVEPG